MRYTLLFIFIIMFQNTSFPQKTIDLKSLQPNEKFLSGFNSTGNYEEYIGDDLFFLINGGAELYHEYGFIKVLKSDYSKNDKNLSIEIYEMEDPLAAYGIYTMFRMQDDKPDVLGDMGQVVKRHAIFMKDRHFVKVTSNIDLNESEEILMKICNGISEKLGKSGFKIPELISDLPEQGNVRYLRGYLALNNVHPLILKNVFNFKHGVAGISEGHKTIILEYENNNKAIDDYKRISNEFEGTKKYSDFISSDNSFEVKDKKGNNITCSVEKSLIVFKIQYTL